jgi:hypothetical protein
LGELAAARSAAAAHSPSKASIFVLVQEKESRSAAPAHSLLLAQQLSLLALLVQKCKY